ncbi:MAG: FtsH protease activity modulator HflK [Treponemataceae bacterium]
MKTSNIIKLIIIAVLAGLLVYKGFVVIEPTEEGIVTKFGKYVRTLPSGPNFLIPFVEKVYRVEVTTVQKEEFGFRTKQTSERSEYENNIVHESEMLTGDLNIINVEWVVQYKITDAKAWLFNVAADQRNKTIRDVSKAVMNALIGDRAIFSIMGSERNNIARLSTEMMNEQFRVLNLGITVLSVQLQNVVPPPQVQEAFEDVNIAIQDMNRLINEGQKVYNEELPKAKGEGLRLLQEAEGYAANRVNTAKGDVARFNAVYTEYVKSPQITRRRLYLETMGDVLSNADNITVVDKSLDNLLPIKELHSKVLSGN